MNPDKGFREWFAKTVIVYAKQRESKIITRHLIQRRHCVYLAETLVYRAFKRTLVGVREICIVGI
jgi:hypothetical protein